MFSWTYRGAPVVNRLDDLKRNLPGGMRSKKRVSRPMNTPEVQLSPKLQKYCDQLQIIERKPTRTDVYYAAGAILQCIREDPGRFNAAEHILLQDLQVELQDLADSQTARSINKIEDAAATVTYYIESHPANFETVSYMTMLDLETKLSSSS